MKTDPTSKSDDTGHLRSRTISRLAVVAASIVALLAGLLLFESNGSGTPSEMETDSTTLAEHPPRIGVSIASNPPVAEQSIAPELALAISVAPDPAQVAIDSLSNTSVSSAEVVATVPEESAEALLTVKQPEPHKSVVPKTGRPSPSSGPLKTDEVRTPLLENKPSPPGAPSGPATKESTGFVVQLGVFSSTENAEDLRGKLQQAGILAKLETRVQVGPFASKEDALKAQEKLRRLGLGNGMLIPTAKRP